MSSEEEERQLFPSFLFPESFPADAATPNSGGEQRKAGRQRRRRKARQVAESDGDDAAAKKRRLTDDQLLRLKEKLAETEEEKGKVMAAAATAGVGANSPSSSSFSTVTHNAAMVDQFEMEDAEADLTYLSEYDYNYVMDLAAGGYLGGVYDQFS